MDVLKSRIGPGPGRRTGGAQMEEDKSTELNEERVGSGDCLDGGRAVGVGIVLAGFLNCSASCL